MTVWGDGSPLRELLHLKVVPWPRALQFRPRWRPTIGLREGIAATYDWYASHV